MTNLEWLEAIKEEDDEFNKGKRDRGSTEIEFRQVKALEIIAEELIDTNRLIRTYIISDGIKMEKDKYPDIHEE